MPDQGKSEYEQPSPQVTAPSWPFEPAMGGITVRQSIRVEREGLVDEVQEQSSKMDGEVRVSTVRPSGRF